MTDPSSNDPVELVCACANLRRAARAISRHYEEALAPVDLSSTQMTVLMYLGRRGACPLTELAAGLAMDRTSLYRALRPLERRDLVRIRATDDRAKEALLTPEGKRHLARAMPHWERAQNEFLARFGEAAWDRIQKGLTKVVSASRGPV